MFAVKCDGGCDIDPGEHKGTVKKVKIYLNYQKEPVVVNYCDAAIEHDEQVPNVKRIEILDDLNG